MCIYHAVTPRSEHAVCYYNKQSTSIAVIFKQSTSYTLYCALPKFNDFDLFSLQAAAAASSAGAGAAAAAASTAGSSAASAAAAASSGNAGIVNFKIVSCDLVLHQSESSTEYTEDIES